MNKKIIIFGASGFIGQYLLQFLSAEGNYLVGVEHKTKISIKDLNIDQQKKIKILGFNDSELESELKSANVIINLSGASIAEKPWTDERKKVLWDSRVKTTEAIKRKLINALADGEQVSNPEGNNKLAHRKELVFINASAIGFYTNFEQNSEKRGAIETAEIKNESSPQGHGFLSNLTAAWEKSVSFSEEELKVLPKNISKKITIRSVMLRIGVVLGKEGGALPPLLLTTKLFVGSVMGSGKQPVAWVSVKEVPHIVKHIIECAVIHGPVNVVAPQNVDFSYFMKQVGKYLRRPVFFKAPAFILKALLKERADLILKGDNVSPSVLLNNGYNFKYPNLQEALENL